MRILYINYINTSSLSSGSSVRPARIQQAFLDAGHELILLTGDQFSRQRLNNINKAKQLIKVKRPDLCYIESPTYPIVRYADRYFIKFIHKQGIPIGYFYRDFYLKFPEYFPRKKGLLRSLKNLVLDYLQHLTDKVLYKCDIVYFPTDSAANMFNYTNKKTLPPAGIARFNKFKKYNHTGIYVGGIIGPYDIKPLLEAYNNLHMNDDSYRLELVCRKSEWDNFNSAFKNASWLSVHHLSGEDIVPLYEKSSIAFVMPDKSNKYNDLAISVKLFEYISYGLPVIAVNTISLKSIITKYNLGISVNPNHIDLINAIHTILRSQDIYKEYRTKVCDSLIKYHLWSHRVDTIIKDLG